MNSINETFKLIKLMIWQKGLIDLEKEKGESMFLGRPDHWYEAGKFRCINGHVFRSYIKTEVLGDVCGSCYGYFVLTFPEDK